MRPSQYHYIKRMWTRNMYKKKRTGCLSNFLKFFLFLFIGGMIAYTGIAAFVIMLCIVPVIGFIYIFIRIFRWALSKRNYSHITKNKPTPNSGENFIIDYDTLSAKESLQRTKKLAEIINTTTDRDEFENSLYQIKKELLFLSRFEGKVNFYGSTPSKDLNRIIENENLTREKFNERTSGFKNHNNDSNKMYKPNPKPQKETFDLERFMIECNAQMQHEDEMEQYKDYN